MNKHENANISHQTLHSGSDVNLRHVSSEVGKDWLQLTAATETEAGGEAPPRPAQTCWRMLGQCVVLHMRGERTYQGPTLIQSSVCQSEVSC